MDGAGTGSPARSAIVLVLLLGALLALAAVSPILANPRAPTGVTPTADGPVGTRQEGNGAPEGEPARLEANRTGPADEEESHGQEGNFHVFLLSLGVCILVAVALGSLCTRYRQPAVVGAIIGGFLLGNMVLGRLYGREISLGSVSATIPQLSFTGEWFGGFGEIGVILLLFLSGLETDVWTLRRTGKIAFSAAVGGVVLPFVLGFLASRIMGFDNHAALVTGAIFTATSVGVTATTLMDAGMISSDIGTAVLSAAVIDDIIGIVMLTIFLGEGLDAGIFLKLVVFLLISALIVLKLIRRYMALADWLHIPHAALALALGGCFVYAAFANMMQLAAITGAFVAGLALSRTPQLNRFAKEVGAIGHGLFIPVFFVWIGATISDFDPSVFWQAALLALVFIPLAIAGKVLGSTIGARLAGFPLHKALRVGIGMVPRMEVALIVVMAAIGQGIYEGRRAQEMLGMTVLLTFLTTLMVPIVLKPALKSSLWEYRREQAEKRIEELREEGFDVEPAYEEIEEAPMYEGEEGSEADKEDLPPL